MINANKPPKRVMSFERSDHIFPAVTQRLTFTIPSKVEWNINNKSIKYK